MAKIEIVIPEAYTALCDWKSAHPDQIPPRDSLRFDINRNRIAFVFDPHNPKYLALQEKSRADSKALRDSLHRVLQSEPGLPFFAKGKRSPSKKQLRRITFLIRPPFFKSESSEIGVWGKRARQQEKQSLWVLHFDEKQCLQLVRSFQDKSREAATGKKIGTLLIIWWESPLRKTKIFLKISTENGE